MMKIKTKLFFNYQEYARRHGKEATRELKLVRDRAAKDIRYLRKKRITSNVAPIYAELIQFTSQDAGNYDPQAKEFIKEKAKEAVNKNKEELKDKIKRAAITTALMGGTGVASYKLARKNKEGKGEGDKKFSEKEKTYSEYGKIRFKNAMAGMKKGLLAGATLSAIPSYILMKRGEKKNNNKLGAAGLAMIGGGTLAGGTIGAIKGLKTANKSIKYLKALESDSNFVTIKAEIVDLRKKLWKYKDKSFFNWLKENDRTLWELNSKYPGLFEEMDLLYPDILISSACPEDFIPQEGFLSIFICSSLGFNISWIDALYKPDTGKYEISFNLPVSKKSIECGNLNRLKKELIKFLTNQKQTSTEIAAKESISRVGSSEKEWKEENMLDISIEEFKSIREKLLKRVDQYTKEIISAIK